MKKKITVLFLCIILILTGCGKQKEIVNEPNEDNENPPVVQEPEPDPEPELKIVDPESTTRPIAVMINNHNDARPNHAGLQDAYIVYEIIVEGGITRLMAIFKDKETARIGSVRSSRHYFLDYAMENDAIYTHFGWSERAKYDISNLGISNVNGLYDNGFWRDWSLGVATEHTAYTSIQNIKDAATYRGYRQTSDKELLLNYSIEEYNIDSQVGAVVANNINITYSHYSNINFIYDPISKVYNRFVKDVPHTDAVTGEQYTTKNIIIAKIKNFTFDNYGRQDLNNIGTGDGYFITNGYAVPITWAKESRGGQTVYKYMNGEEITVNDGNTYIQIQPISQQTIISQ